MSKNSDHIASPTFIKLIIIILTTIRNQIHTKIRSPHLTMTNLDKVYKDFPELIKLFSKEVRFSVASSTFALSRTYGEVVITILRVRTVLQETHLLQLIKHHSCLKQLYSPNFGSRGECSRCNEDLIIIPENLKRNFSSLVTDYVTSFSILILK